MMEGVLKYELGLNKWHGDPSYVLMEKAYKILLDQVWPFPTFIE